tara:strand:- start:192 stop:476 length:285 start_codon:yes stop_codon:yes gene_type:complete
MKNLNDRSIETRVLPANIRKAVNLTIRNYSCLGCDVEFETDQYHRYCDTCKAHRSNNDCIISPDGRLRTNSIIVPLTASGWEHLDSPNSREPQL